MKTFNQAQIKAAYEAISSKIENLTEAAYGMKGKEKRETRRDIREMQTIEASLSRAAMAYGDVEFDIGPVIDYIEYINGEKNAAIEIADGSFAEACYNQNSVKELREIADGEPDQKDMSVWGLTEAQWDEAVCDALYAKRMAV